MMLGSLLTRAAAAIAALLLSVAVAAAQSPDPTRWRPLDPENTLYIDTNYGRVVLELYPEVAPNHVARVKQLARQGFYDGHKFHRVIDGFMAQTGDPLGDGTGGSELGDLQQEFLFRRGPEMPFVEAAVQGGARLGFYKTLPISTQPDQIMSITRDGRATAWGLHCPGVASMARANDPDSANSQFFLMREAYPSLDKRYTIWGRVVWNLEAVRKLAVGEPPANPDQMRQVRVAADVPLSERAPISVLRTDSQDFRKLVQDTRARRGADFSVCDVDIPVRVPETRGEERPWWRVIPFF